MALKKCPKCQQEMPVATRNCKNCGFSFKGEKKEQEQGKKLDSKKDNIISSNKKEIITVVIISIIAILIIALCVLSINANKDSNKKIDSNEQVNYQNDDKTEKIDYDNAEKFEKALNSNEKVKGKIVSFEVLEYHPDSILGINCWAGEHLNFISEEELSVDSGDTIIGKITKEPRSKSGSWVIDYEVISIRKREENKEESVEKNEQEKVQKLNSTHEKINKLINNFYSSNSKEIELNIGELKYSEYYGKKYYNTVEISTPDKSKATFKFNADDELMLVSISSPHLEQTEETKKLIEIIIKSNLFPLNNNQKNEIINKINNGTEIDYKIYSNCEIDNSVSLGSFSIQNKKVKDTETSQDTNSNESGYSTPTVNQQQAVKMAKSYLNYTSFSRKGLIEQLEYEGFSKSDATYGVDNSGADWNEQAAKKAKSYLDYKAFSRKGLIEQLEYEGFTKEQAKYGADSVGLK